MYICTSTVVFFEDTSFSIATCQKVDSAARALSTALEPRTWIVQKESMELIIKKVHVQGFFFKGLF